MPQKKRTSHKSSSKGIREQSTVTEVKVGPSVLLESSFLLALLNPRDINHKGVKSVFGFIEPHSCRFHIPLYVFFEVVSKMVQKERRVSDALKGIEKFLKELRGPLFIGNDLTIQEVVERYKALARNQIRFLQSNDFIIATEGMLASSIILTCDSGMYEKVKRYYGDIYYAATQSKKHIDDIPRFTRRFLKLVKPRSRTPKS